MLVSSAWDAVLAASPSTYGPMTVKYNLNYSQNWLVMALALKAPIAPVAGAPTVNLGSIIVACTTTGATTHTVSLGWGASTNATSYNIYRGSVQGGPYVALGTSSTLTFSDANVLTGNIYHYVVTTVHAAGESSYSNEAVASIP